MRIPRIYHPQPLTDRAEIALSEDAANHVGRVLRMSAGQALQLFDGSNQVFDAEIVRVDKKNVLVRLGDGRVEDIESPLNLHLGGYLARREDGVHHSEVHRAGRQRHYPAVFRALRRQTDGERLAKKIQQWQKIAIAACEQCGRNRIPEIREAMSLEAWCAEQDGSLKLNLHPRASHSINTLPQPVDRVRLLIGPEGGLSADEIAMTTNHGFTDILLGPRVLRTETTALTAITALQVRFGDTG